MNDIPDGSINGLIFLRLLVMRQKLELEDEENGTFSDGGSLSRFIAIRASATFQICGVLLNAYAAPSVFFMRIHADNMRNCFPFLMRLFDR